MSVAHCCEVCCTLFGSLHRWRSPVVFCRAPGGRFWVIRCWLPGESWEALPLSLPPSLRCAVDSALGWLFLPACSSFLALYGFSVSWGSRKSFIHLGLQIWRFKKLTQEIEKLNYFKKWGGNLPTKEIRSMWGSLTEV